MLPSDTDSLMYKIETENVYEVLQLLNFSNYPKDSKQYMATNYLVLAKMKDETSGLLVKGFVGLKSKMYTFKIEDNDEFNKPKEIRKNVVNDELKYED